jgi:hypothetical protein
MNLPMTSLLLRALTFLAILASLPGCGPSHADSTPNPELVVPDVPPSERSQKSPIPAAK